MTPNLRRLFADSKRRQHMNDVEIIAHIRAKEAKQKMLDTHGEALIEALEAILAADERGQGLPYAEAMQRAAKLLAQLEVEAHNG